MAASELLEPFERLLAAACPPAAVRAIERGEPWQAMWREIAGSGFLDALVPEAAGGAGLSLAEAAPLLIALGRHAVPLPVGETMVARALLAEAGHASPEGPIALASGGLTVPFGRVAEHVLVDAGDMLDLHGADRLSVDDTGVPGDLDARIGGDTQRSGVALSRPGGGLRPIAALLRAAGIAGAAARLLEMTIAYAGERVQFGKPIGRQQAVQQQLAVMAEQTVAARLAVELACAHGFPPTPLAAAMAKSAVSAAAPRIAAVAHAVHGAIGISAGFDLQLHTRRLHAWRLAEGSEGFWNRMLGEAALRSGSGSVDWVRETLFA